MSGLRRKTAYVLLRIYKASFSVVFYAAGARCQHKPTCSEYGAECVARHGWWPGGWMAIARFIRCRPGGVSGMIRRPRRNRTCPHGSPGAMATGKQGVGPSRTRQLKTRRKHEISPPDDMFEPYPAAQRPDHANPPGCMTPARQHRRARFTSHVPGKLPNNSGQPA